MKYKVIKMARRSRGFRSKTRRTLKNKLDRPDIRERIGMFKKGDKVALRHNPSIHKGMPHPRFFGKNGVITGRRGESFLVEIKDGNKLKTLISRPEHLKSFK